MTTHVMIDLETLAVSTDAVILSIGAVKFDPNNLEKVSEDSFYCAVDPTSCQHFGLKIDAATVMWWMGADRAAARETLLKDEQIDLATALDAFASWFGNESLPVWSNAATFDIMILKHAFGAIGRECPWSFRDERCYRTFKSLYPGVKIESVGTKHRALDDAIAQAFHMKALCDYLEIIL